MATAKQIWIYTLILIPVSLLLIYPLGVAGAVYALFALSLGGVFVYKAWQLLKEPQEQQIARSLFKYSILYMMLLCTGIVLDSLPLTHNSIATISSIVVKFHPFWL